MKVVVIGAHPDDYELGAGMRLIHHVRRQDEVTGIICSYGERAGDIETRIREAIKAAEFIGMKDIYILGLPDTRFPDVEVIKDRIEEIILPLDPAVVYSHFPNDRHQDHRAVALATTIACRKVPSILAYRSPSTDFNLFQPHLFHIGLHDDFIKKRELLQIYQSQMEREQGIRLKQMMLDSRFYGSIVDHHSKLPIYAEPFCANHFVLNYGEVI
jgi:LmbE family N-acetylglucosaminyl deacetylase